ncbi:MAG: hypothetical protein P1P74_00390 [Desulfuromonadales bacterium]|nr:hypothetical protein [Desulfuromonadales bacterium]MDT8423081.1 hypothetical protein [Desulfuromonadales bacterium]
MMGRLIVLLVAVVLSAGCAGVKIKPVATQTAMIDLKTNTATEVINGISVQAKANPYAVPTAQPSVNIASFSVNFTNNSADEVDFSRDSVVLIADGKKQLRPATVEDLTTILKKDTFYLIPSPYVGYYYLEDRERGANINQFESSLPFYVEYYPEELIAASFPFGKVKTGMEVSGEIFFLADFSTFNFLELRLQPTIGSTTSTEFKLLFSVEK